MNLNQIINMVMRIIMRRAISSGVNAGINAAASGLKRKKGGKAQEPQPQELDAMRETRLPREEVRGADQGGTPVDDEARRKAERRKVRQARRAAQAAKQGGG